MGHRRVGILPKTHHWEALVRELAAFSGSEEQLQSVVRNTLEGVRDRFKKIDSDDAVIAAFRFLVNLSRASSFDESRFRAACGLSMGTSVTPLRLVQSLQNILSGLGGSREYSELAKSAASDAISSWCASHRPEGPTLFGGADPMETWREAATGSGFCELSRLYFSNFVERHLKYFLEREASRHIRTIFERDAFDKRLEAQVQNVSQHAFETSKITQSFAAGWFNKHAMTGEPTDSEIRGFLGVAFGKMRDELLREGNPS